ncbi:MAG: glycoside hydrolase family 38 C-terminal domain-containing protein [Anaerolineaceae bacterium]
MQNLHIISHTHWDREWYRTFQQFRLQLVHLVDNLLTLLDSDPDYKHFMLDGQTIVLEDYLQMRMANFPRLRQYIQEGRVLIGPWYILPDEFLVSPEATIRNLLIGRQICHIFDNRMMVGYIPDPFGHLSQIPQILNGFHIDTACLWRGVPDGAPTLLRWQAPDGSEVLLAHLYNGYGNVADWPKQDLDQSVEYLNDQADKLMPYVPGSHFLMMRGTDHYEPRPNLPETIRYYNQVSDDGRVAVHSTLPAYLAAVTQEIEDSHLELQLLKGELRDPHKAHMLPAVLSARMWIKQRNWYSQTLLERWVEPFALWAELTERGEGAFTPITTFQTHERVADPAPIINQAWKLLITNHPHDSICGCSIDATHADMVSRFDQVDQIGEELTKQALKSLSVAVDSTSDNPDVYASIQVFNAAPYSQTGKVTVVVDLPESGAVNVFDHQGNLVITELEVYEREVTESNIFPLSELQNQLMLAASEGRNSKKLINAHLVAEDGMPTIEAEFSSLLPANQAGLNKALSEIMELILNNPADTLVRAKVYNVKSGQLSFIAEDVPAFGLATWHLARADETKEPAEPIATLGDEDILSIENEYLKLIVDSQDGCLALTDKRSGVTFGGLNLFVDTGDRGDEYNYTPPENDRQVSPEVDFVEISTGQLEQTVYIRYNYRLPVALDEDRTNRAEMTEDCPLDVMLTLPTNAPYVDVEVGFENQVLDHRLEVHFSTGLQVDSARFDGHFDVIERPIELPKTDGSWRELPRPEVPQRTFVDVSVAGIGLMVANLGLPEVAALRAEDGSATLSLTLLRSVGWLSRDDLWNRQGHAGPPLETPEAQVLGLHQFNYRLIPHDGDWLKASQLAHTFQTSLTAEVTPPNHGSLPTPTSLVTVEPASFLVTAIKQSEDETGWIIRGVNLSDATVDLKVKPHLLAKSAALVYLDESPLAELPLTEVGVSTPVKSKQIVSVLFRITDQIG